MSSSEDGAKPQTRRFYKTVGTDHIASDDGPAGYAILLDGRPIRTPAKAPLRVPTADLADAISQEWDAQEDEIRPQTMPMTRIAGTAIDKVAPEIDQVRTDILGYGNTDLVCYRADNPEELIQAQAAAWQPVLDWLARAYDAPLSVTTGIMAAEQPKESIASLRRELDKQNPFELTALSLLTGALGSLCLALAVRDGERTPRHAWEAAFLDEIWQAERWGEDKEATDRRLAILGEIESAHRFLVLTSPPNAHSP